MWPFKKKQTKFLQPDEFFSDCGNDVVKMIDKTLSQKGIELYYVAYVAYLHRKILEEHRKLLSSYNGSTGLSKSFGQGSSPYDSA